MTMEEKKLSNDNMKNKKYQFILFKSNPSCFAEISQSSLQINEA